MRHVARTSPDTLRLAALRLDNCIQDLNSNQLRLKIAIREVSTSWNDAQSRNVIDKVEKLIELVDRQIQKNEEVSTELKRKAERLSEYLDIYTN